MPPEAKDSDATQAALRALHAEVDDQAGVLAAHHAGELQCRRGCSACCVDGLSVFEVEADRIRRAHPALLERGDPHPAGACAFLDGEGACRIYPDRPYVCRTQGLPLRWLAEREDGEIEEGRGVCELNFEGRALESLAEEELWLIGPAEQRLATLQDGEDDGKGQRVALRALFRCACSMLLALVACGDPGWDAAIEGAQRADADLALVAESQRQAARTLDVADPERPILFGDLHFHTSYSWDGFLFGLPLIGGEGAHPPNDACDYARYCSGLDFFALTDHAESLLPAHWEESKQSVRACNALAGDPANPDLVAFMGFEWSQAGLTPEQHWGHRCVVFPDDAEDQLPARPISSVDRKKRWQTLGALFARGRWVQPQHWEANTHYVEYLGELALRDACPEGVPVRELPAECQEFAFTPKALHAKLDEWGFDALTIPHGTAWGTYTPATTTIDKHLDPEQYDPDRMRLIEIMSGHGNSEEYRSWREFEVAESGERVCPEPTADFLPCCWRAGEIMRARCGDLPEKECERRVALARQYGTEAYTRPGQIFPDAPIAEWLDCDQCRDCFKPAFSQRPRETVQYAMALSVEDGSEERLRFRYGFVGSSDNHAARPGTGYKQNDPLRHSDSRGTVPFPMNRFVGQPQPMDDPTMPLRPGQVPFGVLNADMRTTSFLYPGGLAAVHAAGRSREEIWSAFQRREVYGTSGPRILLWFDLTNGANGRAAMGSEHALSAAPEFEVRAVGSLEPLPGCPESSRKALRDARLARLCGGECHHPGDTRRAIAAIEVVRIRTQRVDGEPVGALIEDPWRRFPCDPDPEGCVVRFEDPDFVDAARDTLYYARAHEVESLALNGAPLSTEFDAEGNALAVTLCLGERVDGGGCPAPVQERAWSSPIFVDWAESVAAGEPEAQP